MRLSHSLGKIVIAEGVESRAQLAAVGKLGCDIAQGFLFSKAIQFEEVPHILVAARLAKSRLTEDRQVGGPK